MKMEVSLAGAKKQITSFKNKEMTAVKTNEVINFDNNCCGIL